MDFRILNALALRTIPVGPNYLASLAFPHPRQKSQLRLTTTRKTKRQRRRTVKALRNLEKLGLARRSPEGWETTHAGVEEVYRRKYA